MAKTARVYGKNRIWGNVFKSEKGSWITLNFGYQIGNISYEIQDEKTGDIKLARIVRKKDGSTTLIPVGKAFKSQTKSGKTYWRFTLGFVEMWDSELKKNVVLNNDGLFLNIYILDENKQKKIKTKDGKEYKKIGIVAGQIGIETEPTEIIEEAETQQEPTEEEEIPF